MKILHINNVFGPYARGGAEQVVARTAAEQVGLGHEVHVLTTVPWDRVSVGEELTELNSGVLVHRIFHCCLFLNGAGAGRNSWIRMLNTAWTFFNFPLTLHIWWQLQKIKPDIVHTHNLAGTSFLIPLLLRILRIHHIHTLHDIQLVIPSGRMKIGEEFLFEHHSSAIRLYQRMTLWWFGSPHLVTAPSEWLLTYYKSQNYFLHSRMQLVRHIFAAQLGAPTHGSIRRERFTIMYAGELSEEKGVRMLIEIFEQHVHGLHLPIDLYVLGQGPLADFVKERAARTPEIHYEGIVAPDAVSAYMASAHVVVVPSLIYENSPTVIVEALAVNTPVSVSDIGGAAELISADKRNGWVVTPTHDAWAVHIAWLASHADFVLQKDPQLPHIPDTALEFLSLYE